MENHADIPSALVKIAVGCLVGAGLYAASRYNYLLFHTVAELVSITVAYGLFMVGWNSREFHEDRMVVLLGIAYVYVGSLDLVHTLAYKGMPIFPGASADVPTQFWIAARYLESIALLSVIAVPDRFPKPRIALWGGGAVTVGLLVAVFGGFFPACYREGVGLTTFKVVSEYLIMGILGAALVVLSRRRAACDPDVFRLLAASLICTIAAEFAFTAYVGVYDLSNQIGHYFKLLSFYLIYRAVIAAGLRRPYATLFQHLVENEARYVKAQAIGKVGNWEYHVQSALFWGSAEAKRIYGFEDASHFTTEDVEGCIPERERVHQALVDLIERDAPYDLEFDILAYDTGERRTIISRAQVERDGAGNPLKATGVIQDVTDRKRIEKALQESEAHYRTLVENSHDLIYTVDLEGNFLFTNAAFQQVLGFSDQEIRRINGFTLVHPDDIDYVRAAFSRFLQGLPVSDLQYRYQNHDGEFLYMATNAVPLFDDAGNLYAALGICRDITERKQADDIRERERRRLFTVFDMLPAFVYLQARDYSVPFVNRTFRELFGDPGERPCYELLQGRRAPCPECPTFRTFDSGQPNNWEWTAPDGRVYMVYDNLFPGDAGENLVLEVGIDITGRKQGEERMQAALREKEVLLREIHHRVKNNLTVVTALIEMQAEETTNAEALNLFRDVRNRVLAMSMVHEDLYQSDNLARIEFGPYLERLLANIRQGFAGGTVVVTVEAENIFLDVNKAIPCGLIVAELATNACKYAFPSSVPPSEGGPNELRVAMRRRDAEYTLTVSDNGVGLPPDFDIRRVKTLGLALVRSWASHQLNGRIETVAGPGAIFHIRFSTSSG